MLKSNIIKNLLRINKDDNNQLDSTSNTFDSNTPRDKTTNNQMENGLSDDVIDIEPCRRESQIITKEMVDQIISTIHREYMHEENSMVLRTEFYRLGRSATRPKHLRDIISELKLQQIAVSREISRLVLSNHQSYMEEIRRLMDLQKCLEDACFLSVNSRKKLSQSQNGIKHGVLGLLLKNRRRVRLMSTLNSVNRIKILQRADCWLKDRLKEGRYKEASQCCMEFLRVLHSFQNYNCCIDLTSKLQSTQESIVIQLDLNLSKLCTNFSVKEYVNLMAAYKLLGKSEVAVDNLITSYIRSVHDISEQTLLNSFANTSDAKFNTCAKYSYTQLCKAVGNTSDTFLLALRNVAKSLWSLLKSYYKLCECQSQLKDEELEGEFVSKQLLERKLIQGRVRLWKELEDIIRPLLQTAAFESYPYEGFLEVLEIVNRLIAVGNNFCSQPTDSLHDAVRTQSLRYFQAYHRSRLEELKMFLESESWNLCPVRSSFSIENLQEFRFLSQIKLTTTPNATPTYSNSEDSNNIRRFYSSNHILDTKVDAESSGFENLFENQNETYNPFFKSPNSALSPHNNRDMCIDDYAYYELYSSDDSNDELTSDRLDECSIPGTQKAIKYRKNRFKENRKDSQTFSKILTNTTLNVLRFFGKYLQMMSALKPIAEEVLHFMSQLYDYYLYTVYYYFVRYSTPEITATPIPAGSDTNFQHKYTSNKLISVIKRIETELFTSESQLSPPMGSFYDDLTTPEKTFGLSLRLIGTESLLFLTEQLQNLKPYLEVILSRSSEKTSMSSLIRFYTHTVNVALDLRKPVYCGIANKVINYDSILHQMSQVKWDVKELLSQESPYIDFLVQQFESLHSKLSEINREISIPDIVRQIIFEECTFLTNNILVEGFSVAKKCSTQGRALMRLDFQNFATKVEKIFGMKLPEKQYVENYITAYYLSGEELEKWILEHKEYTPTQLNALKKKKWF